MIKRIQKKRTQKEQNAWLIMRNLMPRAGKTRGNQYELLEYLFENLYETISEAQIREHLLSVKGRLQATGDPVKQAINSALKELQRLPERTFELIKIQETDPYGKTVRSVRLHYTHYDAIIDFPQYREYLEDLLDGESSFVLRTIWCPPPGIKNPLFPGLEGLNLETTQIEPLLGVSAREEITSLDEDTRFIPDSPASHCFLLLYESRDLDIPFLAFFRDATHPDKAREAHYILYRGQEKLSKLRFLHRLWHDIYRDALTDDQVQDIVDTLPQVEPALKGALLNGLVAEQTMNARETV